MKKTMFASGLIAVLGVAWTQPAFASSERFTQPVTPTIEAATDWTPVAVDLAELDVYIDLAGEVLPLDSAGKPLDNPDGYPSTALLIPDENQARLGKCKPYSGRDNPHRSRTGIAASGHGWWDKGTCSNNSAKVYNCLYMKHASDGYWYQKACSPVKTLKPGGGSAQHTVARRDCTTTQTKQWRNHVDVDVVGESDTADNPMREASVACKT